MHTTNKKIFTALALFICLFAVGCVGTKKAQTTKSQLDIRQLQTRTFETDDYKAVLKAMLNVLQDDDYIIDNANTELGFLRAHKTEDVESGWDKFWDAFADGKGRHEKLNVIDVSCNVSQIGEKTKVRANFRLISLRADGTVNYTVSVEGTEFYREFFAKVSKSIFLEEKKI